MYLAAPCTPGRCIIIIVGTRWEGQVRRCLEKGKGCSEGSITVMASSSNFEADISSTSDSEVFSYDLSSELYMLVSELSSNTDNMDLPPSESDSICQPDSGHVGTSRTRMEYDGDSDDSSNPGCWSQLFDNLIIQTQMLFSQSQRIHF